MMWYPFSFLSGAVFVLVVGSQTGDLISGVTGMIFGMIAVAEPEIRKRKKR